MLCHVTLVLCHVALMLRFLLSCDHSVMNDSLCLIAELFLQVTHLFLQIVHAEIVPIVPIEIEIEMGAPATAPFRALWNLFLPQLNPDLFLLAFTQDGQRDCGAFRITAN